MIGVRPARHARAQLSDDLEPIGRVVRTTVSGEIGKVDLEIGHGDGKWMGITQRDLPGGGRRWAGWLIPGSQTRPDLQSLNSQCPRRCSAHEARKEAPAVRDDGVLLPTAIPS